MQRVRLWKSLITPQVFLGHFILTLSAPPSFLLGRARVKINSKQNSHFEKPAVSLLPSRERSDVKPVLRRLHVIHRYHGFHQHRARARRELGRNKWSCSHLGGEETEAEAQLGSGRRQEQTESTPLLFQGRCSACTSLSLAGWTTWNPHQLFWRQTCGRRNQSLQRHLQLPL